MSIKNKLVTAVTTAGLLAGLFGSAFVPAARAVYADGTKDWFSLDTRTAAGSTALIVGTKSAAETGAAETVTAKTLSSGYLVFTSGLLSSTGSLAERTPPTGTAAAATTSTWTASGTCEFEAQEGADSNGTAPALTTLTATSVVFTAAAADTLAQLSVQVEVTGSGTCTVTHVLSAGNTDSQTWTIYTGYANAAAATAVSATKTTITPRANDTLGGSSQLTSGLPTICSRYDVTAAMTTPAICSGHYELSLVVKDATGQNLGATTTGDSRLICSVVSGDAYIDAANTNRVGGADTAGAAATIRAAGLTTETVGNGAAGVYSCAITPKALTTTGKATFKIATVGGTTLITQEVQFLGPVTSVTMTGPSALAVGNAAVADALSVSIKDAAGTAYTGTQTTSAAGSAVLVEANVVETYVGTNTVATGVGAAADGDEKISFAADTCLATDYGKSIKMVYSDSTSGNDISSSITIKCVYAQAKITAMAAKVDGGVSYGDAPSTTSCAAGQSISFEFTATDGVSDIAPRGFTGPDLVISRSWTTAGATGALVFFSGVAQYDLECPSAAGTHWIVFSRTDNDPEADGSQAYQTAKHTFTVTDATGALTTPSISVGPKKIVVTATFPNIISGAVKFEVENAITGVVRTYNRKTNATGQATYRVAARGTFYITAMKADGSVITETVTVNR